ncbi:alpha/beta hydrolase-fold protein [Robertmurraya massiliosenegalensis]|uniref:alpha/beta hydrolase n=1 Tax=Robertmurraya TaxID=2837507 RepID=UPI0039A72A04
MQKRDFEFHYFSQSTEYEYTIQVYVPNTTPPQTGFPIIYVLDGQSYFEFAKHAIKLQSQNKRKTKIEPSIVVGICHDEKDMRQRRFYEFTAPADQYIFPKHAKGKHMDLGENGGAPLFQKFMEEELKPFIEKKFEVDTNKQTLYGHSLAGYYAIWCYLTHCHDFQTYLAISPSIWWNGKELHDYVKKAHPHDLQKLFIAVGEHEGFMVEDAKVFYEELPVPSKMLHIAPNENHASIVPTTISRALRFIREK